ncbi:ribose transport system permease protein [Pararhizobium capsulatum DSM 1112]|uniref:Ribose transport system permease protein n=1 Tax=Pararhizobium capsulatum DSM 1112 TaxID=1121113 RepID=A0ABU0C3T1_9HYPH|nr:ABC transporter permease [Pararhizobium capsulatum]MDQ0323737.1 ribose transport system permease protein [Pararhizobium capsulatum DSM 1112]
MTIVQTSAQGRSGNRSALTRFRKWDASGVLVALLALVIVLTIAAPAFFSQYNLSVVARQASFVGLVALGQTLVLLIGGIDLSVGAAAALSTIVGSLLLTQTGIHPYAVLPLTALFGMCLGCINGFFVAVLRLNPFIVTLASWEVFAGLTLVITKGYPIRPLGETFRVFGQGAVFGVPVPVLIFLGSGAILTFMLARTKFGRNIYAIGGNREAAELVGIRSWRVELLVFGLAGMFAALAGILYASRMDSGQPSVGEGWLMGAITAAIIGGTSLKGGQGTIIGTILGALLMAVLANGIVLMNVSGYWERVIVGVVVLIAILVDLLRRR